MGGGGREREKKGGGGTLLYPPPSPFPFALATQAKTVVVQYVNFTKLQRITLPLSVPVVSVVRMSFIPPNVKQLPNTGL